MRTILKYTLLCLTMLSIVSCEKEDWLERKSQTILGSEQVMNDPNLIVGLLANYYDRLPDDYNMTANGTDDKYAMMTRYDDALWSNSTNLNSQVRNNLVEYNINTWTLWDYTFIRDINVAIENLETFGTKLTTAQKEQFNAEFRFLRAYTYFEIVKRMGGVPLITTQLIAENGDYESLKYPRNKESECYDFIASECDAIKGKIGNAGSTTRACKEAVLALKSRAMLHAASLCKYNNLITPTVTLPGGEVGMPASKEAEYFQKSLDASKEIMTNTAYRLYKGNPSNLGENFYEAIMKKSGNPEIILAQDYLLAKGRTHQFAYRCIPFSLLEDVFEGSAVTPSLNLVESFDYLDGSPGILKTRTTDNSDFIYYDNPQDIFANKDARLYGTVIVPGTSFKGKDIALQAGVMEWNATTNSYRVIEGAYGSVYTDGKTLTGQGGPTRTGSMISCSGFYLKKYLDNASGSATLSRKSDSWWVRFRMGEVYLNACEAAFELGQTAEALGYINTLRERAGFPPNSLSSLTLEKILNERRCELAFEDHRLWDLIRTRTAVAVWNGNVNSKTAQQRALYGYRVIRPGDPARDGKYVYVELMPSPRFTAPRNFRIQNYYSEISQSVINANNLIIRNPGH